MLLLHTFKLATHHGSLEFQGLTSICHCLRLGKYSSLANIPPLAIILTQLINPYSEPSPNLSILSLGAMLMSLQLPSRDQTNL